MFIELGSKVKDSITGFTGIATARHEYMNGCIRYAIQADKLKDGKPIDPEVFDVQQLVVLKSKKPARKKKPGGPYKAPTERNVPSY